MAKLPRHGTIGKNHILSRSSTYRICFFICSKYDTFLKDFTIRFRNPETLEHEASMRQDLNRGNVHWTFPLRSASVGAKRVPLARSTLCVPNRTLLFVYNLSGPGKRVNKPFLKKGVGSWIEKERPLAQWSLKYNLIFMLR